MTSRSRRHRFAVASLLILAAAALLFPPVARTLGRRPEEVRPIVHGARAFEKPYGARYRPGRWRIFRTRIPDDLTAVWAVDERHAWVRGVSGGLYRTRDGGASWEPLVGVDAARFLQILWTGPDRGFALAADGGILRTDDGGAAWTAVREGRADRVLRIDFVDGLHGWATGERGLVIRTRDGGATWDRRPIAESRDLPALQMLSKATGWAGGDGVLLGTRDGGQRWKALESVPGWRFVSGRRGYASDGENVYATQDGGESWKVVRTLESLLQTEDLAPGGPAPEAGPRRGPAPFIARVEFVDRYNGIAEVEDGARQLLFRTRSLGRFWKRVYAARRGGPDELVSVVMADGRNGLAIDGAGNLRVTGDGARTWPVQIAGTSYDLKDLYFADRDRGWAVGARGRILATDDGGKHWREASREIEEPLARVRAAPVALARDRAWAAGKAGTVLASIPEGRPWRSPWRLQRTPTREDILDLDFAAPGRGAAVGGNGLLMTTADGGESWRRRSTGIKEPIVAVALGRGDALWAATASGLYRSTDGGRTLAPLEFPATAVAGDFVDLAAPAPGRLIAVQQDGGILRTADGGASWKASIVEEGARLRTVQFADPDHGWILGRTAKLEDVLFRSEDGGVHWREIALPIHDARAVFFADRQEGWLAGPQSIHRSLDGGLNWSRQAIIDSRFLRAFVLLDGGGVWAAGDNGLVAFHPPAAGPLRPGGSEGDAKPPTSPSRR